MSVHRIAFVRTGSAGRSQGATAFAERERTEREFDGGVVTGGTAPAEQIRETVTDATRGRDLDTDDELDATQSDEPQGPSTNEPGL